MTHLSGPIIIHRLQDLRLRISSQMAHSSRDRLVNRFSAEKKDSGVLLSVNDDMVSFFVKQHQLRTVSRSNVIQDHLSVKNKEGGIVAARHDEVSAMSRPSAGTRSECRDSEWFDTEEAPILNASASSPTVESLQACRLVRQNPFDAFLHALPRSRRHPLHIFRTDRSRVPCRVPMVYGALIDNRDGFETPVRMLAHATRLIGGGLVRRSRIIQ
jgi:hypothetical protein